MFKRYFQSEIDSLKDLGADFSKAHPAVASMLSGPSADPDVERLLEGVAFLTAQLRQKLDDEFPEIIHELIQLIWPHYLRPVPASTIVSFRPRPMLKESRKIPAGIHLASVPVEGTPCIFHTCYDVEIHPLRLVKASLQEPAGKPPSIKLLFELNGLNLSEWQIDTLRFHLAGDITASADLYLLLRNHVKKIVLSSPQAGSPCELMSDCLKPVGYSAEEALIPYPSNSFPGYRLLQEYFILPEKFLFFDLTGWERWTGRGEGGRFEITFEFDEIPFPPPKVKADNFILFATPVINIFPHEADPIRFDHTKTEYLIRPSGTNSSHYQVYTVEKVVGLKHGTAQQKVYDPFELFNPQTGEHPVYHTTIKKSPVEEAINVYLSPAYPLDGELPERETLSITLTCTNGTLPESLRVGDICVPTSSTPEFVEFGNIRPATSYVLPPLGTNLLWRLQSHLSLNYLSLASAQNLQALLELYTFPSARDRSTLLAIRKRIAGIEEITAKPASRIVGGAMMRGQDITARMRQDHFASPGDLYLFGCLLDEFLSSYGSINTYTRFVLQEITRGDTYQWPVRIGDHPLI
ncbi:MAG TPA: type VI secretion system baseplate subunit TssF [Deltaproteobacteria bacterium]|nr:type VI secretion system baseplate subunit TssF [Deltaproteobacteria bacterium]HPJ92381.1 type VI secretion system baseplate subunit TssF [Deltaproteobacteria bacterium]HPR50433.1 type VI secretion system baseplate subunit TssF [Deltaproteobacteria bacterium]